MKHFLTSLLCLLLATVVNAQSWTAPEYGTYPDRFVVYLQLNVNGEQVADGATIAAFIGGECRGVVSSVDPTNASNFFPLEIWGMAEDNSKTVTFKAEYKNVVYNFTKTLSYDFGGTYATIPFVLNIDAISGLTVTNPINVTQKTGTTYNLNQNVAYAYNKKDGSAYTKLNESSVDTNVSTFSYEWNSRSNDISITDGVMTINHYPEGDITASVGLLVNGIPYLDAINTTIKITEPTVSVTDLTLSVSSIECWVGEEIKSLIDAVTTIAPADATNKNIDIKPLTGSEEGFEVSPVAAGYIAAKAGTWTVRVSSAEKQEIYKDITVVVKQHVTNIDATTTSLTVDLADDVYAEITKLITITPADATNKKLTLTPMSDGYVDAQGKAIKEGEFIVNVAAEDYAQKTIDVTVKIESSVNFTVPRTLATTISTPVELKLTDLTGKGFKAEDVDIKFNEDGVTAQKSADGLTFTITSERIGEIIYTVSYLGRDRAFGTLSVKGTIALKAGWNWISNYTNASVVLVDESNNYLTEYFTGDNKIKEIRTQQLLLFNDPTYGMFGSIINIMPETMYKVNVAADRTITVPSVTATSQNALVVSRKGYTWFAYPTIGNHTFSYYKDNNLLTGASKGDMIIGKDGFATYGINGWVASEGFKLETGKGYIYYQEEAQWKTLSFGDNYVAEPQGNGAKAMTVSAADVWQYDANAYEDNMCIIAKVSGIEPSANYSVGAFVNGECRGKGTFVNDEVMFINVAGKPGETVTFQLYNSETDEYYDITEKMSYTTVKGSLNAPAKMSTPMVTGVKELCTDNDADTDEDAYNISGQRVDATAKGVIIKGGKKYIK